MDNSRRMERYRADNDATGRNLTQLTTRGVFRSLLKIPDLSPRAPARDPFDEDELRAEQRGGSNLGNLESDSDEDGDGDTMFSPFEFTDEVHDTDEVQGLEVSTELLRDRLCRSGADELAALLSADEGSTASVERSGDVSGSEAVLEPESDDEGDEGPSAATPGPGSRWRCDDCGKDYADRHARSKHRRLKHGTAGQFPCLQCGKVFGLKYRLKGHLNDVHTTFKYQCTAADCTNSFKTNRSLKKHMKKKHSQ